MKLSVSQVEIYDDTTHALVAKVALEEDGVVSIKLLEKAFDAGSWRELADAVAQAIKMMEAE